MTATSSSDTGVGQSGGVERDSGQLAPLLPGGEPIESLLRKAQFFTPGAPTADHREVHRVGGRGAEEFYRERWRHDKEVRSTHGVNCTGSCSWKIYVKDGIITWETQQTDYPSVGPDSPEYEPRGCPRGASFSWYTYSPSRVRYPYVRGPLLQMWREARSRLGDPVLAWAEISGDPRRAARYKSARGMGGFVRARWDEVSELIAAAHVHTVKEYGPDRVVGFSPVRTNATEPLSSPLWPVARQRNRRPPGMPQRSWALLIRGFRVRSPGAPPRSETYRLQDRTLRPYADRSWSTSRAAGWGGCSGGRGRHMTATR
jgi:nitrate reductase alpha subunit